MIPRHEADKLAANSLLAGFCFGMAKIDPKFTAIDLRNFSLDNPRKRLADLEQISDELVNFNTTNKRKL